MRVTVKKKVEFNKNPIIDILHFIIQQDIDYDSIVDDDNDDGRVLRDYEFKITQDQLDDISKFNSEDIVIKYLNNTFSFDFIKQVKGNLFGFSYQLDSDCGLYCFYILIEVV